ncbi:MULTISPECIES: alpha/beta fold hydrolase [unclassified Dehalobacter]|uniref:alpha/beta hydrolase n=1 Tax=unclassified Dehalobacter TaxID=2635733 RepID=UPI000E6D0F4B|nr:MULTISPECIES: alpha/beta fold hydrolase [unclassified Dehalobacter]RJE47968.1 esterase [Dehalobacter sp. MCB1]TCX50624.1 esterase [Dehalobacter sp. 14DCB1]TCX52132.1 esterase [Dehalobacter sp. 12DCB1]
MNAIDDEKTKCLIIHGFGGGVHEVKPLAEYLTALGYDVICPILKGHSTTRHEMKKATYLDWIDSAERELLRLKEIGDEILLIGFSMGGLIAFNLACKHDIKAIVTINTPIFYWNIYQVFRNIADDVKNKKPNHIKRYLQAKKISPFLSMIQFLLLLHQTKPKLKKINCPILIIQAEDDDTVRRKSVDYINKHVSSDRKKIRYFQKGGHLILLSPMAEQVMICVEDFLQDK